MTLKEKTSKFVIERRFALSTVMRDLQDGNVQLLYHIHDVPGQQTPVTIVSPNLASISLNFRDIYMSEFDLMMYTTHIVYSIHS